MTRVRVSVVTPFHNTADYLDECIRSVLAQSLPDFEYILVNNCSTDGSREIAQRHAAADPRIRVIDNTTFLSQVRNYNAALSHIGPESTYTKMVQADDWLYRNCLSEMVALAETRASIGIVSSYRLAGRQVKEVGLGHGDSVLSGREVCRRQLLEGIHVFGSPSTVMFRSEIVRARQPFYEEGRLHEDTEACYDIMRSWSFGFVHQILSFTRTDNDSIMSAARRFNPALLDKLIVLRRFGTDVLEPAEFESCWHDHETRYLRQLAEAHLRRREAAFWAYHAKGQASIDYVPPMGRQAAAMVGVLSDWLLNPKNTLTQWLGMRQRRSVSTR